MLYIYKRRSSLTGQEAWCTSYLLAEKTRQIPERKKGKEKSLVKSVKKNAKTQEMEAIVIAANETQNICFQSLQKKKMPGSKSLEEVARILKRKLPRLSRVSSQKNWHFSTKRAKIV